MRRAKDNRRVPKRYYHPERTHCPHCHHVLKRAYPLWRKYIVFLTGRYLVISVGFWCRNPKCPEAKRRRVFASQAAQALTVRGSSFALEVIVQIGYWRFWKRWTVTQIHEVLTQERHVPISEREVLYLIGIFLVLLRCTYHRRVEEHAAYFRRHGLFLSIDALKPEKGNTALYVVRELKFSLVLQVVPLLSADQLTLAHRVLQPVKALGFRIRGVVSDDEKAMLQAVAQVWPGVAQQTCQLHCLQDAATPIAAADQTLKKALKKAVRAPFYAVCRALSQLPPEDPRHAVLTTYAELIRATLTEGSKPPFALGGLRVFEDLTRLDASLQRSRKKGATHSWINSWRWSNAAPPSPRSTGASNANASGWSSWSGSWTHRKTRARAQPGAVSSAASRTSWSNWKRMPGTIPLRPRWSHISVPPCDTAGRACLPAMPGPNATGLTTAWRPSLGACAPASAKFMDASPSTSSSCATESGRSSSIPPKPLPKSYNAFSSSTKASLIRSIDAFEKLKAGFKCSTVSAITLAVASSN